MWVSTLTACEQRVRGICRTINRTRHKYSPPSFTHLSTTVSPTRNPEPSQISEENIHNEEVMHQDAPVLSTETQKDGTPPVSSVHTGDRGSRGSLDTNLV